MPTTDPTTDPTTTDPATPSATTPSSTTGSAARAAGAVRRLVAAHPAATQLTLMFGIAWAVLIPMALAGLPMDLGMLAVVPFAQLLPAVLISAAVGGRPGVRDLFGRIFRWRVGLRWYALSLLAIPLGCLTVSTVYGTGNWTALLTDPAVILAYLNQLSIVPIVNLWEEAAWTGMVQDPLGRRYGPVAAAVVTGLFFGLLHLPLRIGKPDMAFSLAFAMVLAIGLRLFIGWLYYGSGCSLLVAALTHATFNATNNGDLLTRAAPGSALLDDLAFYLCAVLGIAVAVATRGRLGMRDDVQHRTTP